MFQINADSNSFNNIMLIKIFFLIFYQVFIICLSNYCFFLHSFINFPKHCQLWQNSDSADVYNLCCVSYQIVQKYICQISLIFLKKTFLFCNHFHFSFSFKHLFCFLNHLKNIYSISKLNKTINLAKILLNFHSKLNLLLQYN